LLKGYDDLDDARRAEKREEIVTFVTVMIYAKMTVTIMMSRMSRSTAIYMVMTVMR
jgi:hypothetical protein